MAAFSATIEAQLSGATVRAAHMVMFDFASGPVRVWPGFGDLLAAGQTWSGLSNLGSLSSLSAGPGQAVEEMTFQLAADETILANFAADAEEATGREVNVYLQFFDIRKEDGSGNWVKWQPLDEPFQVFWGIMGPLSAERPEADDDPVAARAMRVISVTASNAFINRGRPSFGFFSDVDQKSRHPGDNIFVNVSKMADARVNWPHFEA